MELTIRPLESAEDAAAFRSLNEEWIARNFTVEEQDRRQLDDPIAAYITTGGQILIAESGGRRVGCVALVPDGTGAYELSKMAVAPELRGQGIGRRLLDAAIDYARDVGATLALPRQLDEARERRAPLRVGSGSSTSRPRRCTCRTPGRTCSCSSCSERARDVGHAPPTAGGSGSLGLPPIALRNASRNRWPRESGGKRLRARSSFVPE